MYTLRTISALVFSILSQAIAFNHPEIQWKTVSTSNFTINYYSKTEPAVFATWKIAEEAYATLAPLYNYTPFQKMTISIAEYDDYSNGFAEWLSGSILIWVPDAQFDLRSNNTWLRNVITHEMAHIMSLEQKKALQIVDINVSFKVSTPHEAYGISNPIPLISEVPLWLAEGIAQFETEQKHNDAYDSRREMILRCAVRSNTMLSLDEMGNFNHDRIGNELVYNQGFAFTRYLAQQIGVKNLRQIVTLGTTQKTNFLDEFTNATGLSTRNMYSTWMDSLRSMYSSRFSSLNEQYTTLAGRGTTNQLPKYSPDGSMIAWLSSGTDDRGRTDLCIANAATPEKVQLIKYAHTSFCFSENSQKIFYIRSRNPNKNGSFFNDLFSCDLKTGKKKRLTLDARIYDVCAIPKSKLLLCVLYTEAGYGLFTCSPEQGTFSLIVAPEMGNPVLQSTVNPKNSDSIIFSKIVNGQSHLFATMLSAPGSPLQISQGDAQEESPFWSANGRVYYSADYDGVFNIYSVAPDGSGIQKHTETAGGYFTPQTTPDGKIIASLYQGRKFSIVTTMPDAEPVAPATAPKAMFQSLPVAGGTVNIKATPYVGLMRRGYWELSTGAEISCNNILLPPVYTDEADKLYFHAVAQQYRSDALHKSQQILSFGIGGVSLLGDNNTQASGNRLQSPVNLPPLINHDSLSKSPLFHPHAGVTSLPPTRTSSHIVRSLRHQPSYSASNEQQQTPAINILPQSGFAYENSSLSPTLGFSTNAQLNLGAESFHFVLQPYFTQQIGREWSWGGSIEMQTIPKYRVTQFITPFFLQWTHTGYINEDINYNLAGISQGELGVGYSSLPALILDSYNDTSLVKTEGWQLQLQLLHSISLFKYSSLIFSTFSNARFYNQPILDISLFNNGYPSEMLHNQSDVYLFSSNRAKFTFPLNRTINKGSRYYCEALYGSVAYSLIGYANRTFLESTRNFTREAFTDPGFMPGSLFLDHQLTYELNLGINKSYLFFSNTQFSISHSLIRKRASMSLTAGFQ